MANEHELIKRDGNCPANYNSCSTFAAADAGACCTAGSFCTLDHARNIACCPTGATCTGTVLRSTATTTAGGVVFGSGTTTTTTTSGPVATATATGTVSYVSDAYFPFPYIPTSYSNSAACNSAYQACQTNYAACTADLQGSGNGVTIVAPGGGITVSPTVQNLGEASATSICSSLSNVACYGIVSSNCAQFGTAGASFVVGTSTNMGPRQTMGCFAKAGMMMVGVGIARQMV